MVGAKVKSLREARCWSQAHLAEASCVNIRTIQRLEAGEPCAHETMLAIAAALDVDLGELGAAARVRTADAPIAPRLDPARASAIGAVAAAPCLLFVAVNALKQWLGIPAPYDALASAGSRIVTAATFNALSPFLFFGGALAAVLLCALSQIRPRCSRQSGLLSLQAIDIRLSAPAMAVLLIALLGAGALALYAVAEQLGTIAAR